MNNEFNSGYQYDRCVSRGICSINPTTAALQEVIILYLKIAAYYGLKFEDMGERNECVYKLILNTISVLSSNYELSVRNFEVINSVFQDKLPKFINEYEELCKKNNIEILKPESCLILDKNTDINEYIRLGEREFNKRIQSVSADVLNLLRLMFLLVKSISVNIFTCESYGYKQNEETSFILKLLNCSEKNPEELKELIIDAAKVDCELMRKIRNVQEELYGKQAEYDVSFSTTKGRAVLVVGSNLCELEQILDKLKDTDIDVYTHDNMMVAHSFPKFREYKNLKGQFGQGMENCLLDFSTFPGPIILTRNSLFNVENLYRGLLFTTDFAYSKGVIPIKNNDFSELITAAENSRGFRKGKICTSEKTGFSYDSAYKKINEKISSGKFSKILVAGIRGYSKEEDDYFQTLIRHLPNNILLISLSCCEEKDNIICFNAVYDSYAMLKISEYVINKVPQKADVLFPFCDRHTLSILLFLTTIGVNKIFVGSWNQIVLKPNIIDGLRKNFKVFEMSMPKNDLSIIEEE